MMTGNKGTFSAGDMARRGMPRGPRRPLGKGAAASLGYPTIEGLLESEDFAKINEGFESVRKQAEELEANSRSGREKRRARLAVAAFDKAFDLIRELLEIKSKMIQQKG